MWLTARALWSMQAFPPASGGASHHVHGGDVALEEHLAKSGAPGTEGGPTPGEPMCLAANGHAQ